jgi:glucan phosphoethanolaminetransferase (alkaline phosphatase superfamily)
MKLFQAFVIVLLGILGVILESKADAKSDFPLIFGLFFILIILILLLLIYFFIGIIRFKRSKQKAHFIPFLICLISLLFIFGYWWYSKGIYNSKSLYKAYGYPGKIDGREDTEIDFKENGKLMVHAMYKFSDSYYWGSYEQKGDTLILNIATDFPLGNKAIIKEHSLRFTTDSFEYYLSRPLR